MSKKIMAGILALASLGTFTAVQAANVDTGPPACGVLDEEGIHGTIEVCQGDSFTAIASRLAPGCTSLQVTALRDKIYAANGGRNPKEGEIIHVVLGDIPTCDSTTSTTSISSTSTTTSISPTTTTAQTSTTSAQTTTTTSTNEPTTTTTLPDQSNAFIENFDGAPATPQPFKSPIWDVTVHNRDNQEQLLPQIVHHGPDCAPPPAVHNTDQSFEQAVFLCRNHVMTANQGAGYAAIELTPAALADWTNGTATIRWNMSTINGNRDWPSIDITPFLQTVQVPVNTGLFPDLQGYAKNMIHVQVADNAPHMWAEIIANGQGVKWPGQAEDWKIPGNRDSWESFLTPSAERRDTFEIKISKTHLSVCMPADPLDGIPAQTHCWIDHDIPALNFTKAVVQFGHHSYTPTKDCSPPAPPTDCYMTWHWDSVMIDPAVPFTMIHSTPRAYSDSTSATYTLAEPAPAGAYVRFMAERRPGIDATDVRISFNGAPRVVATVQQSTVLSQPQHMASFWMPVPQGTTTITLTPGNNTSSFASQDLSVWRT